MPATQQDPTTIPLVKLVTRAFMRDPYPALEELRERTPPTAPILRNGFRMWVVTRYDDVRRVLADKSFARDVGKRLRSRAVTMIAPERAALLPIGVRRGVIDRDGEDHVRLRGLLTEAFHRNEIAKLRPRIEQVIDELLDVLPVDEPVDLVGRFTRPLAATVISEVVGIPPGEREGFPDWESSILTGTSKEEIEGAGVNMYDFCLRMVRLKREEPGDDPLTHMVRAETEGKLDEDEAASTLGNLLIGGMEASTAIGTGVVLLLGHREQLDRLLADMSLLPACVEEILRFEGPFRLLGPRFADADLELDGVTIPSGELIALCPAAANRDPRHFSNPDTFDMTRRPNPHLSFGHGEHHCIGVHLGRLETAIGLERFFTRFPRSRLMVPWEEMPWRPGSYQRRLDNLPIVLAG